MIRVDVCVVGAGPAGLGAAQRLAAGGRSVLVVDEQPRPGGQYYRGVSDAVAAQSGRHRPAGARLVAAVEAAGARLLPATTVWTVDDRGRLLVWNRDTGLDEIDARHVVVAAGASERVLPFPGWTSPRVGTVGLAQHLASEGVRVGDRVVIAGSGPFLLPVACALLERGATVAAVLEAGHPYRPDLAALVTARHPARLAEFARYRLRLRRARVPLHSGRRVARASEEPSGVLRVHDTAGGRYDVDALCVGYGFRPQAELLRLLGARTETDPLSGDELPVVDDRGATSVPGLWAAGEVRGIAGAHAALAEGALVGDAILADVAAGTGGAGGADGTRGRRQRAATARHFATVLAGRYPTPRALAADVVADLPDDTVVCRCEHVSAGAVRAVTGAVPGDLDTVKSRTRAGMGPCQARECGPALAALCGTDSAAFTAREPLRPVPLDVIADGLPS